MALQGDPELLVPGTNAMGISLFRTLCEDDRSNVFISPLSISIALAMAAAGTTEASLTMQQMRAHLGHDKVGDEAMVLASMERLVSEAASADPQVEFLLANSVWAKLLRREYVTLCQKWFHADAQPLTGPEPINAWCGAKTKGLIDHVIDVIQEDSPCVLVNAVYFKGGWQTPFREANTDDDVFETFEGKQLPCMMMNNSGDMNWSAAGTATAVELPYGSGRFSAVLILPNDKGEKAMDAIVKGIDTAFWERLTRFRREEVELKLPRFKMEYGTKSLAAVLKEPDRHPGVPAAFALNHGFDRMIPEDQLLPERLHDFCIGDVLHKAVVEVNEEGTVAAAVTVVEMRDSCTSVGPPQEFKYFFCDRPFLFVVRDTQTNAIHFIGKVAEPVLEGIAATFSGSKSAPKKQRPPAADSDEEESRPPKQQGGSHGSAKHGSDGQTQKGGCVLS